ncbi:uncharacterized protein [Diadema setosum]|uniref:uncharacterized protein n=1 Tax=Diadema setosum TaxID=31175 RepID=UPI003B3B557B
MCGVQLSLNKCAEEAGKGTFSIQIADLMEKMSRTPSVVYIPENSTERLSFNATDYRSKYEFTWPEKARAVLQKAPADRTAEDIRLVRSLMRGLYSFRKYSSVLQDLICKVIRYAKYGRRRVVVRKGHPGFSFYFIFSGSVGVTLEEDEMNAFVKKEVNILKKGASFGEIALIKDTRRKATVVCLQDTEFLVVDADEFFDNNLHLHIQQEFEYRLDFLSRMKIFSTWATENLEEISDMGRLEEYCNESLIVKDARNTDWLLIITKGRADVLKLVDLAQLYMSKQAEEEEVIQMSRKARVLSGRSVTMWSDDIGSKVMQHQQQQQQQRQQMLQDQDRERGGQRATTGASRAGLESQRKTSAKGSTVNGRRRPKTTGQIASRMRTPTDNEVDDDDNERRIRSRSATVRLKEPDKRVLSPGEDEDDDEDVELEESGTSRSRPRTGTASHRTTSEPSDETPCRLPDYITLGLETIKAPGVDAGVYIQVDALRPGDCFGIQGVLGHMPHLSVVSHGCELIRISMSKFREYADEETLNKVRELIPTYASDLELWRSFRKQNKWNNFKSGVVREVRRHAKPTGSSVRGGGADSKSSVKGSVTSDWVTNTWSRRNTGRDSVGPSTTPLPKIPTNADDEGKSPKSPRLRRRGKSGLSSAATTRPNSRAQSRAASTRYTESRSATRQSFSQHDLKVLERRRSSMPAARLASASQSFGYQSLSHAQSMVGGATGGSMGMGGERQLNARSSMPHMHIPDLASFTKPTYTSSRSWRELKS